MDDCSCPPPRVYEKKYCCGEGGGCYCDIGNRVWYGNGGELETSITAESNPTWCNNDTFGDVAPG